MMMQRNTTSSNKNIEIKGMNIYKDNKGRTIYYDRLFKKAYYIAPLDYKSFSLYQQRFFLGLAVAIVIMSFMHGKQIAMIWIGIALGLLIYGVMEYKFRSFLKKCSTVKFDVNNLSATKTSNVSETPSRLVLKAILLTALGVLLVINAYAQGYDSFIIAMCYVVAAFCLVGALFQVKSLMDQKKLNK